MDSRPFSCFTRMGSEPTHLGRSHDGRLRRMNCVRRTISRVSSSSLEETPECHEGWREIHASAAAMTHEASTCRRLSQMNDLRALTVGMTSAVRYSQSGSGPSSVTTYWQKKAKSSRITFLRASMISRSRAAGSSWGRAVIDIVYRRWYTALERTSNDECNCDVGIRGYRAVAED